jgi:hypothetical protein
MMAETKIMTFDEKVRGAMKVAKEYLDTLSKIKMPDETRVVKAIEVAHKLSAQLSTLSLLQKSKSSEDIAKALKNIELESEYTVEHRAIERYALADQLPEPEIVAKLYRLFDKNYNGAPERAIKKETVVLISAEEFKKKLAPRYGTERKKSKKR